MFSDNAETLFLLLHLYAPLSGKHSLDEFFQLECVRIYASIGL